MNIQRELPKSHALLRFGRTDQQNLLDESDVNNPAFRALTFDELSEAYREQMEALLEGE